MIDEVAATQVAKAGRMFLKKKDYFQAVRSFPAFGN